jgi:hypothetical protein
VRIPFFSGAIPSPDGLSWRFRMAGIDLAAAWPELLAELMCLRCLLFLHCRISPFSHRLVVRHKLHLRVQRVQS